MDGKNTEPTGSAETAPSGATPRQGRKAPPAWVYLLATVLASVAAVGVLFGSRWLDDDAPDDTQEESQPAGGLVPPEDTSGDPAPLTTYLTLAGEETTLEEYRGRPLVVNFWASTCAPCVREMPEFEQVFQRYGEQDDVAFLGINIGDTQGAAEEMVATTEITYDVGRDTKRAVFPGFGGIGMPTTALVSEEGTILEVITGPISGQELSEKITDTLLA